MNKYLIALLIAVLVPNLAPAQTRTVGVDASGILQAPVAFLWANITNADGSLTITQLAGGGRITVGLGRDGKPSSTNDLLLPIEGYNIFWDDFEGDELSGYSAFVGRKSSSGHQYSVFGSGSNSMHMINGYLENINPSVANPFYIVVTNSTPGTGLGDWQSGAWTRFGCIISHTGTFGTFLPSVTFLTHATTNAPLDIGIHAAWQSYYAVLQRALAENIIPATDYYPFGSPGNTYGPQKHIFEVQWQSNIVQMRFDDMVLNGYSTNMISWANKPCFMYELTDCLTNSAKIRIHSVWAGKAYPDFADRINNATTNAGVGKVWTATNTMGQGTWSNQTAQAGSMAFNLNQFDTNGTVDIKTGAFQTNFNGWGIGTNKGNIYIGDISGADGRLLLWDNTGGDYYSTIGAADGAMVFTIANSAHQLIFDASFPSLYPGYNVLDLGTTTNPFRTLFATNIHMDGVTASRAAVFNSNKQLTNASGTADATTFLNGLGAYAVPAGSGSGNFSTNADGSGEIIGAFTNSSTLVVWGNATFAGLSDFNDPVIVSAAFTVNGANPARFGGLMEVSAGVFASAMQTTNALTMYNVTASRAAIFNSSKQITNSAAVDTTELEFLDGVTAAIQTQFLNATNRTETKQNGSAVLTNLVGTVARNVTNLVSLSTTNATSKPLTNSYTAGVLTLFGLEAGANISLTPNASNIVIASTGGGAATNAVSGFSSNGVFYSGITNYNFVGNARLTNANSTLTIGQPGISNLADVAIGTIAGPLLDRDVLWYDAATKQWFNQSAFFQINYTITSVITNLTIIVGSNMDQSVYIRATNSFGLTLSGSPLNGEMLTVIVSNQNKTADISMTNITFNPSPNMTVTNYVIGSNSISSFTWVYSTNFLATGGRWELRATFGKEIELLAGSGITFTTNSTASSITVSAASTVVTNSIWVSAGAMAPAGGSTSEGGRNGATIATVTNTSMVSDIYNFTKGTNDTVCFSWQPGPNFAGDLLFNLYWQTTNAINGASNVVWEVSAAAYGSNNVMGTYTYITNQTFRFWSSNSLQIAKCPQLTVTNLNNETLLGLRITRLSTNASDAALGFAQLLGARIAFTSTNLFGGYP